MGQLLASVRQLRMKIALKRRELTDPKTIEFVDEIEHDLEAMED
jgi:hypothetical protein